MFKDTIWTHCSATRPEWMEFNTGEQKVAEITQWHLKKGWRGCGYAIIIDRDGKRYKGRDLDNDGDVFEETGAHVKGYNKNGIGICLIGGFGSNENDKFLDHFTEAQWVSWLEAIQEIRDWGVDKGMSFTVRGHNEIAAKACPGFNVQKALKKKVVDLDSTPISGDILATVTQGITAIGSSGMLTLLADLDPIPQTVAIAGIMLLAGVFVWKLFQDNKQKRRRL